MKEVFTVPGSSAKGAPDAASPRAGKSLPVFADRRGMGWVLAVTGMIGFLASAQLVLERLALYEDPDYVTSCDISPLISCGEVFRTWQAAVFGFPNPLLGIVSFAVVLTTAMALFGGARFSRWYWAGLQTGVSLGMVFVVWLWSQALFEIHILCVYCLVVWAAMIVLFVLLTARNILHSVIPVPAAAARFVGEWAPALAVLVILATAASVFFSFIDGFIP